MHSGAPVLMRSPDAEKSDMMSRGFHIASALRWEKEA
jgi:hypothetical protein